MGLPADLVLRDATAADLPAIAGLRQASGWGVHEWALRAVIGCSWARCVVVEDAGGEVVGVGSGAAYGPLGFVGNMVVGEAHRRRGVGAHILRTILAYLEETGAVRVELFATAAGRPLYERFGFDLTEPGALAAIPDSAAAADPAITVRLADVRDLAALAAYDAPRFGGDRSQLLDLLAADEAHPIAIAWRDGTIAGFAWVRPGAERMGPFVADDPSAAAALLADAFDRHPQAGVLTTVLPIANTRGVSWLERAGVALDPWDSRMARGPEVARRLDTIYGNTVGALG